MPWPEPVTIAFAYSTVDILRPPYEALIEEFNESYPHITVELQQMASWQPMNNLADVDVLTIYGGILPALLEQVAAIATLTSHVRHYTEAIHAALGAQHLNDGARIADRCRLIPDDDQDFMGGLRETQHTVGDAGSGINEQHIEVNAQPTERVDNAGMMGGRELRHLTEPGCARYNHDAGRAIHDDILQLTSAAHDVREEEEPCARATPLDRGGSRDHERNVDWDLPAGDGPDTDGIHHVTPGCT